MRRKGNEEQGPPSPFFPLSVPPREKRLRQQAAVRQYCRYHQGGPTAGPLVKTLHQREHCGVREQEQHEAGRENHQRAFFAPIQDVGRQLAGRALARPPWARSGSDFPRRNEPKHEDAGPEQCGGHEEDRANRQKVSARPHCGGRQIRADGGETGIAAEPVADGSWPTKPRLIAATAGPRTQLAKECSTAAASTTTKMGDDAYARR